MLLDHATESVAALREGLDSGRVGTVLYRSLRH